MRTVPEQPRMLECVLFDQFRPDLSIVHEAFVSEEARRLLKAEGTEVDHESEILSVGGPRSIVDWRESGGLTFEEAVGKAGLISETKTALDTAGLPIC